MKPREFITRVALVVSLLGLALPAAAQSLVPAHADNPKIKWINLAGMLSQFPYDSPSYALRTVGPCSVYDCPSQIIDVTATTGKLHQWTGRYVIKQRDPAYGIKFISHPRSSVKRNYMTGVHRTLIDMRLSSANAFPQTIDAWFEVAEGVGFPWAVADDLFPGFSTAVNTPQYPDSFEAHKRLPIVTGDDDTTAPELTTNLLAPFTLSTDPTFPFTTTVSQPVQLTNDPRINPAKQVRWYVMQPVPKIVQLVNNKSRRCMTVVSGDNPQGARVRQGDCNSPTQTDRAFHFYLPATVDTNEFFADIARVGGDFPVLIQSNYKGRCVDLPNESIAMNERVVTGQCTTHDSQRWYLKVLNITNNKSAVTLRNGKSGLCLGVEYDSTAEYARMMQTSCQATNTSQQWIVQLTTENR